MNRCINSSKSAVAAGLSAALIMVLPVIAAPAAKSNKSEVVPHSVFVIPANPQEGRDPFYPNSTRPYEGAPAGAKTIGDVTSLVLRGISGPPDHRLAIINSHTFGVGDEQDVTTAHGRIHIRCVEVKDNSVVIESGGQNYELKYTTNP